MKYRCRSVRSEWLTVNFEIPIVKVGSGALGIVKIGFGGLGIVIEMRTVRTGQERVMLMSPH